MKEKGIDLFIESAKKIKSLYPQVKFNVVGYCEEDYLNKLKFYVSKGLIYYHGYAENIKPFLLSANCIIHPTYYPEGISNILLECSASGRPIITSNIPGCREVVDDFFNGFLFESKNLTDLINKIIHFIKIDYNTKKELANNARHKVEKEFNRLIVINEYLKAMNLLK